MRDLLERADLVDLRALGDGGSPSTFERMNLRKLSAFRCDLALVDRATAALPGTALRYDHTTRVGPLGRRN